MAIITQPTFLPGPIAYGGDRNTIPLTNDGSQGFASIEKGFPAITQKPIAQGGLPPQRGDFNGLFNLLSQYIVYQQNGGLYAYNPDFDYSPLQMVTYSDKLWLCKAQNGPSVPVGPQAPADGSDYWGTMADGDLNNLTATGQRTISEVLNAGNAALYPELTFTVSADYPEWSIAQYTPDFAGWLCIYAQFQATAGVTLGGGRVAVGTPSPFSDCVVLEDLGDGTATSSYTRGLIFPCVAGKTYNICKNHGVESPSPWTVFNVRYYPVFKE